MKKAIIAIFAVGLLAIPVALANTQAAKPGKAKPLETAVDCMAPAMYHGAYQSMTAAQLAAYCVEVATEIHAAFP